MLNSTARDIIASTPEENVTPSEHRGLARGNDFLSKGLVEFDLRQDEAAPVFEGPPPGLRLVNYHFRGASFEIGNDAAIVDRAADLRAALASESLYLEARLGDKRLPAKIRFRVCWQEKVAGEINGKGGGGAAGGKLLFGVEFARPVRGFFAIRARRYRTSENFVPTLAAADPLDPHRQVFFQVREFSESGVLLSTSLSNRHLLAGMRLQDCSLATPGKSVAQAVTLEIRNTRPAPAAEEGVFLLGAAIVDARPEYLELVQSYLAAFSLPTSEGSRIEALAEAGFVGKRLKEKLTYRVIDSDEEYAKVLRLRYAGYGLHGKVKAGASWREQGEGFRAEGQLVCAYLGGEMVGSMEFRFLDDPAQVDTLRTQRLVDVREIRRKLGLGRLVEINKLVIHPKAQGSDVVVGLMQKIHALLVARGGYDVLLVATDKLVSLYQRIGFTRTGFSCAHPTVEGLRLHAMVLRSEAYLRAEGVNPYAWSVIYEIGQRYFEELGRVRPVRFGPGKRLVRLVSERAATLQAWRKSFRRRRPVATGASAESEPGVAVPGSVRSSATDPSDLAAPAIDTKWTAQHISADVMLPYVLQADDTVGAEIVDLILSGLGMPRRYFREHGNWVSIPFLDAFLERFAKYGSVDDLSRQAGARALKADVLGLKYYFIKLFLNPEAAFRISAKVIPNFNRTRTYHVRECAAGRVTIEVGLVDRTLLPKHRASCLNWESNFASYIRLMTGREGTVRKLACCYAGAANCTYEIRWDARAKLLLRAGGGLAAAGAVAGIAYALFSRFSPALAGAYLASGVLLAACTAILLRGLRARRQYTAINQQLSQYQQASDERYSQLQNSKEELDRRYRELLLLQETATAVMKNGGLRQILGTTLGSVCENFGFARAFVMLANEDRTQLRMEAVHGITEHLAKLWDFKVDLSAERENPLVLSSVYHSGHPVMIQDLKDHGALLNEASRKLIGALGVESFIMVPVPSENGRWGVMVADRAQSRVSPTDVDLLSRVARQLGMALDKQAMLDKEKQEKEYFKKFVPAYERTKLIGRSGSLSWQLRDTVAMFIDISGYTQALDALSPSAAAGLVNGFYALAHNRGREFGAYTDKFIGDAVLLTWGYLDAIGPGADRPGDAAVRCALAILEGLPALNAELARGGIPPIGLRIGIFRGPAVCGLFGCEERMEFTGIGSTLNAASRLQSLCKEHGAAIAISESVMQGLTFALDKPWRVVADVALRGINQPMKVGFFRNEQAS